MKKIIVVCLLSGLTAMVQAQWDISVRVTVPVESVSVVKSAIDKYPPLYSNTVSVISTNGISYTNTVRTVVAENDRQKFKRLLSVALQRDVDMIIQRGLSRAATVGD